MQEVVGLFGTCGDSKWREQGAIPLLTEANVPYFNPVVSDWTPECAAVEAQHAATDKVIMQVITGETTGIASMAESGWLAAQAILRDQSFVIVLENMPADQDAAGLRINKTRDLLRKHIQALNSNNVFLCTSVEEGTRKAIELFFNKKITPHTPLQHTKTSQNIKEISELLFTSGIVDDRRSLIQVNLTIAGWFLDNKKTIKDVP